jgi:hypothetical protein
LLEVRALLPLARDPLSALLLPVEERLLVEGRFALEGVRPLVPARGELTEPLAMSRWPACARPR